MFRRVCQMAAPVRRPTTMFGRDRQLAALGVKSAVFSCMLSCLCVVLSELCTELLSQVALAPSFKVWELSDIERFQHVDVALFNQLPHNSQFHRHWHSISQSIIEIMLLHNSFVKHDQPAGVSVISQEFFKNIFWLHAALCLWVKK